MRVKPDYSPAQPTEAKRYGMDFTNDLLAADSVASCTITLVALNGIDPSPATRLSGPAIITGNIVQQLISNLVAGERYLVIFTATTSQAETLVLYGAVSCEDPTS